MKNIIIGVVYRSHTAIDNFIHDIEPIYADINSENKHVYVMGDFNIDLLKADSNRPTHEYIELLYSHSMLPSIYKPTRITATTATCIDNIITNNENIAQSTILVNDISDHMPTILSTNLDMDNKTYKKFVYRRNLCDKNINELKKRLANTNWQQILNNYDVNYDYNQFTETFEKLYNECIPLVRRKVNKRKDPLSPWITKGLLKSINRKNKLYKQYLHKPSASNLQKFKSYKNKLNMLIRKSKRMHYFKKFNNSMNDMKKTWQQINCIIGKGKRKSPQSTFKDDCDNNITEPKEISNYRAKTCFEYKTHR